MKTRGKERGESQHTVYAELKQSGEGKETGKTSRVRSYEILHTCNFMPNKMKAKVGSETQVQGVNMEAGIARRR